MHKKKQGKDSGKTPKGKTPSIEEGLLFPAEDAIKGAEDERSLAPKHRGRKRSMVTEERPPLHSPAEMRQILEGIQEIETPTGIKYINLRLTQKMIIGTRESTGKEFTINLAELYNAYQNCLRFTSPEVKRHIFMGHSPSVVLLKMIKAKLLT